MDEDFFTGKTIRRPLHSQRMNALRLVFILSFTLFLVSCSTKSSTIKEGFAYRMTQEQAIQVVKSAMASNISADRINPSSDPLTTSGYIRFAIDTHTFAASAIPVGADLFGFLVKGWGTMLASGTIKQKAIYRDLVQRADLISGRVSLDR